MGQMSVGEAARKLGAKPKDITDLFYLRKLDNEVCPVSSGRRSIPEHYLPTIRKALEKREDRRREMAS